MKSQVLFLIMDSWWPGVFRSCYVFVLFDSFSTDVMLLS